MTRSRLILTLCALSIGGSAFAQGEWRAVPDLAGRYGHAMAYDLVRQRVVLFGGTTRQASPNKGFLYFADTWEWDGKDWELKSPLHSPEPREYHAMAWDPVRQSVLLFGGLTQNPFQLFGDTWEWDGQDWHKLTPLASPAARYGVGLATDLARGRVVLFGGATSLGWFSPSLDDTWEWDGTTWTQRLPNHVPARRQYPGMAYLPKTRGVILYGGQEGINPITDEITWEWDGRDWLAHPRSADTYTGRGPLWTRGGDIMVTHPSGQSVLLVEGGEFSSNQNTFETWEWDGGRWQQLQLASTPPAGGVATVATDLARGEVVYSWGSETWAFTPTTRTWRSVSDWTTPGIPSCGPTPVVHDPLRDEFVALEQRASGMRTWRLRDNRYERLTPPKSPPWRSGTSMTWHGGLGKVLMFGGGGSGCGGPFFNDTWLWDGHTWQEHVSAQQPPTEASPPAIVYDSRRDRVVLVAARYGPPQTWEWDVQNGWQQIATPNRPTQRGGHTMAYDPRRGRTVLFGGIEQPAGIRIADTWEYDGTDWRQIATAQSPSVGALLEAYVEPLGGVVAIDWGYTGVVATWLFDGQTWRQLVTDGEPANGAFYPPLAAPYDTNRQRLRLFYSSNKAIAPAHSIWEWKIRTLDVSQPRPRLGETIRFDLDVPTQPGRTWLFGIAFADRPAIPLRPVPFVGTEVLPLAPDALLIATLQAQLGGVLDPSGKGSVQVTIPTNPVLVERELYTAAVTLDASGNIGTISNGVTLEVVR